MSTWRIDLFQITVPVGDCAIYLLVEVAGMTRTSRNIVHGAVLIDGGKPEKFCVSRIRNTIQLINGTYKFAEGQGFQDPGTDDTDGNRKLRFDSIVITHWDWDHYDGVLGILMDGFNLTREKFEDELKTKFGDDWATTSTMLRLPNWYCKYKAIDKSTAFTVWKATRPDKTFVTSQGPSLKTYGDANNLTTIYVPYSVTRAKRTKSMRDHQSFIAGRSGPWGIKGSSSTGQFLIRSLYDATYNARDTGAGAGLASLGPSKEYYRLNDPSTWLKGTPLYVNFSKLVDHYDDYLGVDLFTGKNGTTAWASVDGPDTLATSQGLKVAGPPALCVIAGFQRVIGNQALATGDNILQNNGVELFTRDEAVNLVVLPPKVDSKDIAVKSFVESSESSAKPKPFAAFHPPIERVISTKAPGIGTAASGAVYDSKLKNGASIAVLGIVAVAPATATSPKVQILSFAGGDLLWDVEGALAHWLVAKYRVASNRLFLRTLALKISHHGSRGSTAINLLNVLHTDNFVVSNSIYGDYGHPSFEVVLTIRAHIQMWKSIKTIAAAKARKGGGTLVTQLLPDIDHPLICTSTPRWVDVRTLDIFPSNVDALNKDATAAAVNYFQAAVHARFDMTTETGASGSAADDDGDVLAAYQKLLPGDADKPVKLGLIRHLLRRPFSLISKDGSLGGRKLGAQLIAMGMDPAGQPNAVVYPLNEGDDHGEALKFSLNWKVKDPPKTPTAKDKSRRLTLDATRPKVSTAASAVSATELSSIPVVDHTAAAMAAGSSDDRTIAEIAALSLKPPAAAIDDAYYDIEDGAANDSQDEDDDGEDDGYSSDEEEEAVVLPKSQGKGPQLKRKTSLVLLGKPSLPSLPKAAPEPPTGSSSDTKTPLVPLIRNVESSGLQADNPAPALTASESSPESFYLLSSDFTGIAPDTEIAFLTAGDPFEKFVLRVPKGYITVVRDPASPLGTEQVVSVEPSDDWGGLVLSGSLDVTDVQFSLTVTADAQNRQSATVSAITAGISLGDSTLSFSTDDAPAMFGLPTTSSPHQPILYLDNYDLIPLGLSNSVSELSLTSILELVAPPWLTDPTQPVSFVADQVADNLKFSLAKTANARNGLYLQPDDTSTSYLRLEFSLTSAVDDLIGWLKSHGMMPLNGITVHNCVFSCILAARTEVLGGNSGSSVGSSFVFSGEIDFQSDKIQFWIEFRNGSAQLVLEFPNSNPSNIVEDIFTWLRDSLDLGDASSQKSDLSSDKAKQLIPSNDISVTIHQVKVNLGGGGFSCSVVLEVVIFGTFFFTTFRFPNFGLRAELWCSVPVADDPTMRYVPWYESFQELVPFDVSGTGVPGSVDFGTMAQHSSSSSSPAIPTPPDIGFLSFQEAAIDIQVSPSSALQVTLSATVSLQAPPTDIPLVWPRTLSVMATGTKVGTSPNSTTEWDVELSSSLYLPQRPQAPNAGNGVTIDLLATKSSDRWTLSANAQGLDFGSLYSYFDTDARESVMDILEGIGITQIELDYVHGPKDARDLRVQGGFQLKTLLLNFDYHWTKTATPSIPSIPGSSPTPVASSWTFDAFLAPIAASGAQVTLIDTIGEFIPDGDNSSILADLKAIPFLSDIKLATADAGEQDSPVAFGMAKSSVSGAISMFLRIQLITDCGTISILFTQRKAPPSSSGGTTPSTTPSRTNGVKRYIRVRLDKLPTLQGVPIIGTLAPPFDSIDYAYVQDISTPGSGGGLLSSDVIDLNECMQSLGGDAAIMYKDAQSAVQTASQNNFDNGGSGGGSGGSGSGGGGGGGNPPTNTMPSLRNGHHFLVMSEGKVVLDHTFGGDSSPDPPEPPASNPPAPGTQVVASKALTEKDSESDATAADSGSTMGSQKKSIGPLTISNVGIQVKNSRVYILIDATVMMGTMELSFQGFGVGLLLADLFKLPTSWSISDFDVVLSGLGVEFNDPPILIAGGFKQELTSAYEGYLGGLLISIPPYSIEAVGAYRHTFNPDFRSVFMFGRLDGPLLTLEFAEISGVAVSFGYNYNLRTPQGSDLENFPLLSKQGPSTTSGDPLDMIIGTGPASFSSWLTAQQGCYFFSIGLKADSFEILTIEAALLFQINGGLPKISIIGRATVVEPPMESDGEKPAITFVYAELNMIATLDLGGSLVIEAQLSSNSYVMNPLCHLQGGFALCYWFPTSPYAGDWVFSIGGYHPAFKPPTYWPVPPRVGISWDLSDELHVGGEAFFAITPQIIMGGGRLYATFSAGPIYADFEAWASFLINFKPLFFVADIGVSISVGVDFHIGIIHIHFGGSIDAELFLHGPPFGGYVSVDFRIVHVTIHFGDSNPQPPALTLEQFIDVVRKPGLTDATGDGSIPSDPESKDPGDTSKPDLIVVSLVAGASTDKVKKYSQKGGDDEWYVRAGQFRFRVESKVAVREAYIASDILDETKKPPVDVVEHITTDSPNKVYARLTQSANEMTSVLHVRVQKPTVAPDRGVGHEWRLLTSIKSLPQALWGQYTSLSDPTPSDGSSNNYIDTLLNGSQGTSTSTIPHLMGYTFVPPPPSKPALNFPTFNVVESMSEGVFQQADPSPTPSNSKNPLIPPSADNVEKRPHEPPSAEVETTPAPQTFTQGRGSDAEWTAVHDGWAGADDGAVQALADLVAGAFGWGNPAALPAPSVGGGPVRVLNGSKPVQLLTDTQSVDDFNRYYMSCPWVTVD